MTLEQRLMIAQTFVLIATGVVVAWYTWETRQIRLATEKNVTALYKQLIPAIEQDLKRRIDLFRSTQPNFSEWTVSQGFFDGKGRMWSRNRGSLARDIVITPIGDFQISTLPERPFPASAIPPDGILYLYVDGLPTQGVVFRPSPNRVYSMEGGVEREQANLTPDELYLFGFIIEYTDVTGERRSKTIIHYGNDRFEEFGPHSEVHADLPDGTRITVQTTQPPIGIQ